jgi:hypothetical protein
MPKKRANFEKALDKAARMIQAQLDTLPRALARKKVKELGKIASKAYRSKSGTSGRARRTRAIRLSSRSRAKTA